MSLVSKWGSGLSLNLLFSLGLLKNESMKENLSLHPFVRYLSSSLKFGVFIGSANKMHQ